MFVQTNCKLPREKYKKKKQKYLGKFFTSLFLTLQIVPWDVTLMRKKILKTNMCWL